MSKFALVLAVVAAMGSGSLLMAAEKVAEKADPKAANSPLTGEVKALDGSTVDLAKYKGKVVLIVNVASKCGNTPQYEGLEKLYEKYGDQGLVVLGFPANEFGKQEPGSSKEIAEFCSATYHVKFPMFEKIVVKGDGIAPLYKTLTSTDKYSGDISWNFEKFLIGRDGQVVSRFKPGVKPETKDVVSAIEAELAKK